MRRGWIILCCMTAWLLGAPAARADSRQDELYDVYVATIKQELTAHGYETGPPSGTLDPDTVRAILQYQHDAGLTADGQATPELLNHLMFALPQIRNTRPQTESSLVSQIQAHLADRGYYAGLVDGKAGPRTREAIEMFQADAGLPVTGEVNRALLEYLATKDPGIRIN